MERKSKHKGSVSAILCSDIHLREDTPICRTDDYMAAQWRKIFYVAEQQRTYNCPVLCGGDLFNYWKPSPLLLTEAIKYLPKRFHTVYGQHDLPQHNLELAYKTGIYTLWTAGHLSILPGYHWGQEDELEIEQDLVIGGRVIMVRHITTYIGTLPFEATPALKLLKDNPTYDLILTGDNHKPFTAELDGRLLVNPGSIMRMTADQIDHTPRVYLYYAESNTVEPFYLPIDDNVISREHIDKIEQRNERIDAFISRLDTTALDGSLATFEENLRVFEQVNNIRQEVMQIVYEAIDTETK